MCILLALPRPDPEVKILLSDCGTLSLMIVHAMSARKGGEFRIGTQKEHSLLMYHANVKDIIITTYLP